MKRLFLKLLRKSVSDSLYCRVRYFIKFKHFLSLKNPKTYNAKLNWIKLYYHNPILHTLVDKYYVRDYIKEKIGEKYLINIIGYYTKVEDIAFSKLPNQFVLKGTHGSGWVLVCKDKTNFDWDLACTEMKKWLSTDFYKKFGEWAYKDVQPGIICEEYMEEQGADSLLDYKIYCFNGEPKLCHVDVDRFTNHNRVFYNLDWQKEPFSLCYPLATKDVIKPHNWSEMLSICQQLAKNLVFVRVDLYNINGVIYFGELTFTPGNGFEIFTPNCYDKIVGEMLELPKKRLY